MKFSKITLLYRKISIFLSTQNAGLKGFRQGSCGVHEKQALVLVNYGGSQGQQIFDLSTHIIQTIASQFGVKLEREVNIIPTHESIL